MFQGPPIIARRSKVEGPRQTELSRLLHATGGATVRELHAAMPDPPATLCGLRTLLNRMARRGLVRRRRSGHHKELIYLPALVTEQIQRSAFARVATEHFGGSYAAAIDALLQLAARDISLRSED